MLWKCFLGLIVALKGAAALADGSPVIKPEEAAANVDKEVIVEYTVNSARVLDDKNIGFLNSERDNRDEKNFTAFITPKGMRAFKAERKMENPSAELLGKKIRVKGKIEMHKSRPEIKVERPEQVEVVKESTEK